MINRAAIIGCLLVATGASACPAQVIQLPTFSFFTVSTTVSVPDSGSAYLGGVRRARYGMTSRGVPGLNKVPGLSRLFSNRGSGSSLSSSGASVTATIIDHAEMDALLLGEAAGRRPAGTALTETDRKALRLSSHIGRATKADLDLGGGAPRESVAAIRLRNDVAARAHIAEMQDYWQRAQLCESQKRFGAARVSYDIIVRRGSGKLRELAAARLAQLRAPSKSAPAKNQAASNAAYRSAGTTNTPAAKPGQLAPEHVRRLP